MLIATINGSGIFYFVQHMKMVGRGQFLQNVTCRTLAIQSRYSYWKKGKSDVKTIFKSSWCLCGNLLHRNYVVVLINMVEHGFQ